MVISVDGEASPATEIPTIAFQKTRLLAGLLFLIGRHSSALGPFALMHRVIPVIGKRRFKILLRRLLHVFTERNSELNAWTTKAIGYYAAMSLRDHIVVHGNSAHQPLP